MLSCIKWDLKKIVRQVRFLLFGYLLLLGLLFFLPDSAAGSFYFNLINILTAVGCSFFALYPCYHLHSFFQGRYRLLEHSAGLSFLQVLPAKLAVNLALVLISLVLAHFASSAMSRFPTENVSYFTIHYDRISWHYLLLYAAGLPLIWTFLNQAARRFLPSLREVLSFIGTYFLGSLLAGVLYGTHGLFYTLLLLALLAFAVERLERSSQ